MKAELKTLFIGFAMLAFSCGEDSEEPVSTGPPCRLDSFTRDTKDTFTYTYNSDQLLVDLSEGKLEILVI